VGGRATQTPPTPRQKRQTNTPAFSKKRHALVPVKAVARFRGALGGELARRARARGGGGALVGRVRAGDLAVLDADDAPLRVFF
jgi:hypothetical protein